jgi:two-component system LytT family response regulator
MPLRVLVVDDETPARQRLEDLVAKTEGLELAAACASGAEAVEAIRRRRPDLVLLDVQMPDMSGLDVVRRVGPGRMPPTIFVTAYDRYAIDAFEVAALDYLLKPFDDARFEQAVGRAQEFVRLRETDRLRRRLADLVEETGDTGEAEPAGDEPSAGQPPLERIAVRERNQLRIVPIDDVRYVTAEGTYVKLHTDERSYLIRERLKTLDARLPDDFCRIHRSTIVRLSEIESLVPGAQGRTVVRLTDGTRLRVSRTRREALERRLGVER